MPNQTPHILIVDDSKENRILLKMLLEDDYQVSEVDSGHGCLEAVRANKPDLILLDVNMPGMNGYEVCTQLRSQHETKHMPIIFVSALDSTEERLAGFEAGGDEYVIKPVDGADLLTKVQSCLNRQQETFTAYDKAEQAMKIALEAMTVSSELGQIVEFVKRGHEIKTTEDIGNAILAITNEFNLTASVMLETDNIYFFGCEPDSMEANFLRKIPENSPRIITKGIRTIIYQKNMILLIKDLPVDDETKCGRLRDHLAVIMDIADSFVTQLNTELKVKQQRARLLEEVIKLAEQQIETTASQLKQQQQQSEQITNGFIDQLETMLFSLGLDDDQEQQLMQLANTTGLQLGDLAKQNEGIDQQLYVIVDKLKGFLTMQQ